MIFLASNPFIEAYIQSDLLGKLIIFSLLLLSIISWILILYKMWVAYTAKRRAQEFYQLFQQHKQSPLLLEWKKNDHSNPFYVLYAILRKQTVDLLTKNRRFGQAKDKEQPPCLSPADVDSVAAQLISGISLQTKHLERHLFFLSTIVSLAPFLGLLGTVWGILTTFSDLQAHTGGSTHQIVLGGLSLALATTVLGLIDAIPALIGYSYLKNAIRDFQTEMECFSSELISAVEIQYRQVDIK